MFMFGCISFFGEVLQVIGVFIIILFKGFLINFLRGFHFFDDFFIILDKNFELINGARN